MFSLTCGLNKSSLVDLSGFVCREGGVEDGASPPQRIKGNSGEGNLLNKVQA